MKKITVPSSLYEKFRAFDKSNILTDEQLLVSIMDLADKNTKYNEQKLNVVRKR